MKTDHPNLVLVFPDQMRGQALGFLNEDPVLTPNLDGFARESLVLPEAVATYPVCSPFRAMLMTGKYPHSNRVIGNCTSKNAPHGCELQTTDTCWSDILSTQGYDMSYIGKWHLDSPRAPYIDCANNDGDVKWNEWCPPERRHGFAHWYSYGTYDTHTRPMYWSTNAGREQFHYVDQWGPIHEADLAVDYIHNVNNTQRDPANPFALVVSMNPPHMPYDLVPPHYADRYKEGDIEDWCKRPNVPPAGTQWGEYYRRNIRNYFGMVTGVDEQFGRILGALESTGLSDNTIVLFTSDHGNCLGMHNLISKNNHYEESMRIPFLIRWPGKIAPRTDDLLLSAPDIYPTLMQLMGYAEDIPPEVEGTGYGSLFAGETGIGRPSSQLYTRIEVEAPAYGARGVRTHAHTLAIDLLPEKQPVIQLYDNIGDPCQLTDIAADSPLLVHDLIKGELAHQLGRARDPWIKHIDTLLTGMSSENS